MICGGENVKILFLILAAAPMFAAEPSACADSRDLRLVNGKIVTMAAPNVDGRIGFVVGHHPEWALRFLRRKAQPLH